MDGELGRTTGQGNKAQTKGIGSGQTLVAQQQEKAKHGTGLVRLPG